MSGGVVDINHGKVASAAREVYDPLVAMLKALLEKAENGEIQGAAVAYSYHDGVCTYWISSRDSSFGLIGAVEAAKHAMFAHDDE